MVARFRDDPSAARCRTSIVLTSVTAGAVSIIDAYIASDSHGLASARVVGGIAVDVSVGYDAVFFGAEPTVSVLVHTTGGVQLVQLGPLPPLDAEGMARKMLGGIDDCFLREGRDFFSHFHKFNPKWAIDPYEHTQVVLHRWDTDVSGLEPDEVVELYGGSNGDRVSRVMATRDGSAQLSLLSRPVVGDGREFSLRRIGSDGGQIIGESNRPGEELGTEARVIRLTQTLLSHRSTVVLATSAVAIEVGLVSGTETLAVVRSGALDLYDVTAPDRPRLLASLEALDAVGTRIGRRGLFVWGPQGVDQLSAERTALGPYLRRLSNVRAYDVAVWRDHVVVLDLAGLASVDEAGQFIRYRSTAHGKSLAIVNGAVAVAGESSLDIFDLHNPSEPVGRIESFRCDRLFNATSSGAGSDLVAQTADGYVTVDLTDPTAPRVSTWHDSVPDRALVTDAGTVLVVASDNATSVELYTVSARRTY